MAERIDRQTGGREPSIPVTSAATIEGFLEAIYHNAPGRITTIDSQGTILTTNRVSPPENESSVIGSSIYDYYLPEFHDTARRVLDRVLKTGLPGEYEVQLRKKSDGRLYWYFVRVGRLEMPDRPASLILFGTDITAVKAAGQELAESEERYRLLIENAAEGVTVVRDGRMLFFNTRALEITGYTAEEFAELPSWATVHPDDLPLTQRYRRLRAEGKPAPRRYNFRIVRKDGQVRWIDFCPVIIPWGDRSAVMQVFSDITRRLKAEQELRRREADLRGLFETAEDFAVYRLKAGGHNPWNVEVDLVSPSLTRILGLDDPYRVEDWFDILHPEDLPRVEKAHHETADRGVFNETFRIFHRGLGEWRWIQAVTRTTNPEDGSAPGGNGMLIDITDRVRLEEQLARAQKLESIGRLAAGIAHEINSPAQHLASNAYFLWNTFTRLMLLNGQYAEVIERLRQGRMPDEEQLAELARVESSPDMDFIHREAPQAIQSIINGLNRLTDITTSMKRLAHPGGREKTVLDLREVVDSAVTVTRPEWKKAARLKVELEAGLPPVSGLPGELVQVLVNLITNAAHSVAAARGEEENRPGRIDVTVGAAAGWVELKVADNGQGLPQGAGEDIFEPFFTTKEVGQGTGLGLAISRGVIVDRHDGSLECCDHPGGGAVFTIRLPADERPDPGVGQRKV